jgi:hypothetical protein
MRCGYNRERPLNNVTVCIVEAEPRIVSGREAKARRPAGPKGQQAAVQWRFARTVSVVKRAAASPWSVCGIEVGPDSVITASRPDSNSVSMIAPEAIILGEIVRTSEGDVPIVECLSGDPHACRITSSCRLKGILVNAFEVLYEAGDEYTLADLVEKPRTLNRTLRVGQEAKQPFRVMRQQIRALVGCKSPRESQRQRVGPNSARCFSAFTSALISSRDAGSANRRWSFSRETVCSTAHGF